MKRLMIRKLIVISQSESRSLEVPLKKDLILFWAEIKLESLLLSKAYLLLWDVNAKGLRRIGKN